MTDEQINRLVAERVMGWTQARGRWIDPSGDGYDDYGNPPAYCTDPAAWAGLLVWLAADREPRGTSLDYWPDEQDWEVTIGAMPDEEITRCRDALPGRALALAALKAYGVEI